MAYLFTKGWAEEPQAVVWFLNSPQSLHGKGLIPTVALLGEAGSFRR